MPLPNSTRKMLRRKPEQKVVPAAAAHGNGEYEVGPPIYGTGGGCNYKARKFFVPLTNSNGDVAIRAHEYAHLAVDAVLPDLDRIFTVKIDNGWVQTVLDNVVNGFARQHGVSSITDLPLPVFDKHTIIPPNQERLLHAQRVLQILSVKNSCRDKVLTTKDQSVLRSASHKLRNIGASLTFNNGQPRKNGRDVTDQIILTAKTLDAYFMPVPEDRKGEDLEGLTKGSGSKVICDSTCPPWCDITMSTATLDKNVSRLRIGRKRRPGFIGAFRNPLRALLPAFDGRAWDTRVKSIGGNVLIDMSSSMSLTPADILRLLETAPAATIAGYCSDGAYKGYLVVLAKNGAYTSHPKPPNTGGGNGCDGLALDWLSQQKGPKVWICDGVVTGHQDRTHPLLNLECRNKCLEHGIAWVESLDEYFEQATKVRP